MSSKPRTESELKEDVEFWRKQYGELESNHKKLVAQLTEQSAELVKVRDAGKHALALLERVTGQRNTMMDHLTIVLTHVSGRSGMRTISKDFCGVCENPNNCPIGAAYKAIDAITNVGVNAPLAKSAA